MIVRVTAVCLLFFVGGAHFQTTPAHNWMTEIYCHRITAEDCKTHSVSERCGTNQITYRNGCELGQAYCADNSIHQAHEGPCTSDPHATRSPEEVQHGSAVILDFECVYLGHRDCKPAINEKVCGTDGKTYSSFCEYSKARCMHRNLHVANMGECSP